MPSGIIDISLVALQHLLVLVLYAPSTVGHRRITGKPLADRQGYPWSSPEIPEANALPLYYREYAVLQALAARHAYLLAVDWSILLLATTDSGTFGEASSRRPMVCLAVHLQLALVDS